MLHSGVCLRTTKASLPCHSPPPAPNFTCCIPHPPHSWPKRPYCALAKARASTTFPHPFVKPPFPHLAYPWPPPHQPQVAQADTEETFRLRCFSPPLQSLSKRIFVILPGLSYLECQVPLAFFLVPGMYWGFLRDYIHIMHLQGPCTHEFCAVSSLEVFSQGCKQPAHH